MRYIRKILTISRVSLVILSLCVACITTSVPAASASGATQPSSHTQIASIVGAPPGLSSAPAACSWGPNRLDVFAKGGDDLLKHRWFSGTWSVWENLGAPQTGLTSAPTAVSWGLGRIDVFVRGGEGNLWHKWYYKQWSVWENLGRPQQGGGDVVSLYIRDNTAPAASSWGAGRLDIFVSDQVGQLNHLWFGSGKWQGWENLGGTYGGIDGSPGAVATTSWGYPRIDIFVRDVEDVLVQTWWDGTWHGFHRFDDTEGHIAARVVNDYYFAPAVCSLGKNRLDVFFVDYNAHLQQKWYDGSWHPLYNVGGSKKLTASPSAVTWQNLGTTRIDIFSRGDDYGLWQLYYAGSTWHGWNNLGTIS